MLFTNYLSDEAPRMQLMDRNNIQDQTWYTTLMAEGYKHPS